MRTIPLWFVHLLFCASVVSTMAATVAGQQPPVAFEVATVKPSGQNSPPMRLQRLPGNPAGTSNTPLPFLIAWAFSVDESRVVDVPNGAGSARFDIDARPGDAPLAPGQLQTMMQSQLSERFKLAVHRETREQTAYTLVTDDGGPKLKAMPATEPPGPNPFRMGAAGDLSGTRVSTDMLVRVLASQLGRPVENQTGMNRLNDREDRVMRSA